MKKLILLTVLVASQAFGMTKGVPFDMSGVVGFRFNDFDKPTGASTTKVQQTFYLGSLINLPINGETTFFNTGGLLQFRDYRAEGSGFYATSKFIHFDVPAQFVFKPTEMVKLYGGIAASLKLADSCSTDAGTCSNTDVKTITFPLTAGAQFYFAPNFGADVFYEMQTGEVAKDIKGGKAYGAGLLMTF